MSNKEAKKNIGKKKIKDKFQGKYFLASVSFLYLLLFLVNPEDTEKAIKASAAVFIHILPALLFIIFLMAIMNYFINPRTVSRYVGKGSGIKGWFLAICMGVLSHGPIYAWYPLLKDLRKQGMKIGLIAVFLYSRAIKIPLLPLLVYYFGIAFVVILTGYMIIASIIQGHIIQKIER